MRKASSAAPAFVGATTHVAPGWSVPASGTPPPMVVDPSKKKASM